MAYNDLPSPNNTINLFEDFMCILASINFLNGTLNWLTLPTVSGGFIPANSNENGHPGILSNLVVTTISGKSSLFLGALSNGTPQFSYLLGGGSISLNWIVKIVNLSSSSNRYTLRLGVGDTSGSDEANGIYFEYSDNENAGNWVAKTASSSTRTTTNSSTTVTSGWHNFSLLINSNANSVTFLVDGVSIGDITNNIPLTNPTTPFIDIVWSAGTISAGTIFVDAFYMTQNLTTSR